MMFKVIEFVVSAIIILIGLLLWWNTIQDIWYSHVYFFENFYIYIAIFIPIVLVYLYSERGRKWMFKLMSKKEFKWLTIVFVCVTFGVLVYLLTTYGVHGLRKDFLGIFFFSAFGRYIKWILYYMVIKAIYKGLKMIYNESKKNRIIHK